MSKLKVAGKSSIEEVRKILAPVIGGEELADLLGYIENAGDPTGVLTPDFIGQRVLNTLTGDFYWANGLLSTSWSQNGGGAEMDFDSTLITASGAIPGAGQYGGIIVLALTTPDQISAYDAANDSDPLKLLDVIPSADVVLGQQFSPVFGGSIKCPGGLYIKFGASFVGTVRVLHKA